MECCGLEEKETSVNVLCFLLFDADEHGEEEEQNKRRISSLSFERSIPPRPDPDHGSGKLERSDGNCLLLGFLSPFFKSNILVFIESASLDDD